VKKDIRIDRAELFNLLSDLISINSVNPAFDPSSAGETKIGQFVWDFFKHHRISVEKQEVLPSRFNIMGKIRGKAPAHCLLFDAHLDTVSVQGMEIPPFVPEIHNHRMYGRGSCDVKAGLAAMMMALRQVAQNGTEPPLSICLLASVDEEHSFQGIRHLARHIIPAVGAVVAEPTELGIINCHKGILRWKIRVLGRSAHSAKPHLGINAISKTSRLIQTLEENLPPRYASQTHPRLGPATFNVGTISGGVQVNLVPAHCEIAIDRRTLPGETTEEVLGEFAAIIRKLEEDDPDFKAIQDPLTLEDPPLETSSQHPLIASAAAACYRWAGKSSISGVPYATNASKLSQAGIPSIVLGPGNIDQAHTAREFVDLEQVVQAAEIYLDIMTSSL
jgi:succinyl-diaminopimelate desuccinylase